MNKVEFEKIKVQLEVYTRMAVQERINFFGMCALENQEDYEYWDPAFPWLINCDVASSNGVAQLLSRPDEVEGFYDCFFMQYYNTELYFYEGDMEHSFTDIKDDLGATPEQEQELKEINRQAFIDGIEDHWCKDNEIVDYCLNWYKGQNEFSDYVDSIIK